MIFWGIIIALLLTVFGQFLRFEMGSGAFLFLDIYLPLLSAFWARTVLFNRKNLWTEMKRFPLFWHGLILFLLLTLSLFIAGIDLSLTEFLTSGFYLFRYFFLFFFSIIVFHELRRKEENKENSITNIIKIDLNKKEIFVFTAFAVSAILAVLGFIQLVIYPDFRAMAEIGWDPHIGRLLSTWFDPNFLGSFFAFILSIMAGMTALFIKEYGYFFWRNTKNTVSSIHITFFIGLVFLLLAALLFTFSRSALLAFVIPVFLLGLIYFRALLILGIIAILLILPFSPRATERITDGIQSAVSVTQEATMFMPDPTARLRVENFQQGLTLVEENFWTGIGFNTIRLYKTQNIHSSGGFDSSLLTILVTSGIFGLIAFLFFFFSAITKVLWSSLKEKDWKMKGVIIGFCMSFSGILAQSFFINSLFYSLFMVFVFGFIGLSLAENNSHNHN